MLFNVTMVINKNTFTSIWEEVEEELWAVIQVCQRVIDQMKSNRCGISILHVNMIACIE